MLVCVASASAGDSAAPMAEAANNFLASLDAGQRAKASLAFDHPSRRDWHWIPKPTRKGLPLFDMTAEQAKLAEALLRTGLSETGYRKTHAIRELEAALHVLEKDSRHIRDPRKYYVTVFGSPGDKGKWGWGFEGHHLSFNFTIVDGKLVSSAPTFYGANPRLFPGNAGIGPTEGTWTLEQEEKLAHKLFVSLSAEQKKRAWVSQEAPTVMNAGPPAKLHEGAPAGLPASQLSKEQQKKLRQLLEVFCGNVTAEAEKQRLDAIEAAGWEKIHFAWFGSDSLDSPHVYRIQGPTFICELDNTQTDPAGKQANHIHSAWRDLGAPRP